MIDVRLGAERTWVLDGRLEHKDSAGTGASFFPGWRSG